MDTPVLDMIKEDYYLVNNESEHVMIIEDMTITTDVEEGKRLKITGSSLEKILDRRIVWEKTVFKKTYKGDTTEGSIASGFDITVDKRQCHISSSYSRQ